MFSGKSSPQCNKPPPIPPKPIMEKQSFSVNEGGLRKYFPLKTRIYSINDRSSGVDTNLSEKYDALDSTIPSDCNNERCTSPIARLSSNVPTYSEPQQRHATSSEGLQSCFKTDSFKMTDYKSNTSGPAINPIVTEFLEESNNNNPAKCNRVAGTSTVEILEVPIKHKVNNNNNPTFIRSQRQQLFYENNSYATPVDTTTTDDEGGDRSDNDVTLPTDMEVDSILDDSSSDHPPRTSTPNTSRGQVKESPLNNNPRDNDNGTRAYSNQYEPLNNSRDTDELTNASVMNQSSGGEVVGIFDNSDPINNSKDSPQKMDRLQFFNESNPVPTYSILGHRHQESQRQHPHCVDKVMELENLTHSLLEQVEKLKFQVQTLNCKVDELESHKRDQESHKHLSYTFQGSSVPTKSAVSNRLPKRELSQSTSTINRVITPNNGRQSIGPGLNLTYSRNHVASISRNPNTSSYMSSNGLVSNSVNSNPHTLSSTQLCNNAALKTLVRTQGHESTNSLYADSLKSCSTSVSPTNRNHRQSISPTSLMSLPKRNDHTAYTSMLSLCSNGQTGSTLKKVSGVSGSVSNISHIGNHLTNWPSVSDYITTKHRGKDIIYNEEDRIIHMTLYNIPVTMRVPNWTGYDYDVDSVVDAPSVRLKLDWVYGYRGRDCRSNIFFLPTGECVYFVAAIVVLYNPSEKTQRHYLGHTDSVKCLAVHPNKLIIASGQSVVQGKRDQRPIVRVWNTVSLATLRIIGFNEDFDRSICCLAFSKHDQGATLAVVDESNEHTITLLDWQREKNWRLSETNSGHEPVLAIDFHPIDKYSLVTVGKSSINFWDTRGMTLTKKAGLFDKYDKPKYVLCLAFNDLGETITGDSNGNVIIWPRGANRPKKVIHDAHQGGVFSVLAMKDGSYLTGGRDRRIVEWDENFVRTGREAELPEHCGGVRYITYARGSQVLIGTLKNSILIGSLDINFVLIMQGHSEAISTLAVHPNQDQYLTGGFDDQVHFFDARSHDVLWSKCLMMPATAACFSPNALLIVIGSTLGKWLVLDAITQEILFTKCEGSGTINCIKFSPDGNYFCMGSGDSQVYVYQTTEAGNKFFRIGTCVGHSAPIKEIDWSDDSRYIQTQSMNLELLFWKASNCRPIDDSCMIEDLKWHTHNCTVGFSVLGIWSDSIDSSLVNHCDRSNNHDLVASVTDLGNINLFKWPACYNRCLSQKHYGNVERINFIKFLNSDSKLIAIGAKNCVATEWIVDKGESMS